MRIRLAYPGPISVHARLTKSRPWRGMDILYISRSEIRRNPWANPRSDVWLTGYPLRVGISEICPKENLSGATAGGLKGSSGISGEDSGRMNAFFVSSTGSRGPVPCPPAVRQLFLSKRSRPGRSGLETRPAWKQFSPTCPCVAVVAPGKAPGTCTRGGGWVDSLAFAILGLRVPRQASSAGVTPT